MILVRAETIQHFLLLICSPIFLLSTLDVHTPVHIQAAHNNIQAALIKQ